MRKPTLLFYVANSVDATSLYRACGPFFKLGKISDFNLIEAPTSGARTYWTHMSQADAVFLQRPAGMNHLNICRFAKQMGLPLWLDYDDDFLDVPPWNPCHNLYRKEEVIYSIREICKLANVISVSTPELKAKLDQWCSDVRVVPNAHNDYLFRDFPKFEEQSAIVFWRGSKTHRHDLNLAAEGVLAVAKENPEWVFEFLGDKPWFTDYMPDQQTLSSDPIDPIAYFDHLRVVKPAITIVPLRNHPFNHAKSNIAWIESSYAGACTLAPDFPVWRQPGVTLYRDGADFEVKLRDLMQQSDAHRLRLAAQSWQYIRENLFLSTVNKKRAQILEDLFAR